MWDEKGEDTIFALLGVFPQHPAKHILPKLALQILLVGCFPKVLSLFLCPLYLSKEVKIHQKKNFTLRQLAPPSFPKGQELLEQAEWNGMCVGQAIRGTAVQCSALPLFLKFHLGSRIV